MDRVKRALICDLDGTLCLLPPGMDYPAAFTRDYRNDVPNPSVSYLMGITQWLPHGLLTLVLLTGRDERDRDATEDWLEMHFPCYDRLIMRPAGDERPDDVVKKELYESQLSGYEIMGVFEDRPRVCRMWRECGLPVFQVGPGVEF